MAERTTLPSVEFINWEGLYTKQNPETLKVTQLRECKNADFFREYGSMSKLHGTKTVLSGQYTESGTAKSIAWGDFYKTLSQAGSIDRQVLIGAGTTIQKINSSGSLTSLLTSEPDGIVRTSAQLDRFMYITSQDPEVTGSRGQMSKYDGNKISKWGLYAPGRQDTDVETFEDASKFTATNATVANSTEIAFKGTSTSVTKGTSSTEAFIESLNQPPTSVNNVIEDRVEINVFIPQTDFRSLAISGRAISIYAGSDPTLSGNYYRYDFQIGRLNEGWNRLILDFSTFPSGDFGTSVGTPNDDFLSSFRYEFITNNASDEITLYWDNFISLDQGTPIPAFSDTTGSRFPQAPSSTWFYRVTFVDEFGNESNSGPDSITADNTAGVQNYGQIDLTDVPISVNPAVIKRNLYRTVASGTDALFLGVINDNVTTTFTDTTTDVALGSTTPPLVGDTIFDNSAPPNAGILVIWKRTAFLAGDPINPTLLYFSRFNLPDAFPFVNTVEFDERVTGIFSTYLGIVVTTESSYWRIIGDNPDYTVDKVIDGFGAVGGRAVGTARESGWAIDRDGMRLYDLRRAMKVSEVIRDRVDAFNKTDLEDTHSNHSRQHNGVLWFTKDADGIYTDVYFYQYMIDDITKGWFSQVVLAPSTFNILDTWEVEDDNGDYKLYASSDMGMVFELFADDSFDWVNETGQRRPVVMEINTAFMRLGVKADARELEGTSGRVSPRFIEFRAKEATGAGHTWTITVDTSDSASENATIRDTQDITFTFPAGTSLIRLPVGKDLIAGEYVRLKFKNEELGKDLQIMGAKLYYHVRPGQFPVTTPGAGGQN